MYKDDLQSIKESLHNIDTNLYRIANLMAVQLKREVNDTLKEELLELGMD